jgi:pyridoxal phosphate enzyme (YggS family)
MVAANVDTLRSRLTAACRRVGRSPDDVTLVAVAKTFPAEQVRAVVEAGVPDIGENYVQELLQKRALLAGEAIRWHFVGSLQSNKVKQIVPWVTLIHAVDSEGLAREVDRRAGQAGQIQDVLIEVNTTGEATKHGVDPRRAVDLVRSLKSLEHIRIAGLMTIGPFLPDPEGSRPMFRLLRELRGDLAAMGQSNATMRHLSMGMTGDFEVAIEEGATVIRIGTAIFGTRKKRS